MMKKIVIALFIVFFYTKYLLTQTVSGNLSSVTNQTIKLEGFNGLKTYPISTTTSDEWGNFKLNYSKSDYGVGYIISANEKPLIVILNEEDIKLVGISLTKLETLKILKGSENQLFEQYAKDHKSREKAINAWIYLEKIYKFDSLFSNQKTIVSKIEEEKLRIKKEDSNFINSIPKNYYLSWFLPIRKLVSSVSVVAQHRQEEIPSTIKAFRQIDYADQRLYKSGLLKDVIDNHFWLIENCGYSLDSAFSEMKLSIDAMLVKLEFDEHKLNEVANHLFNLLERQSLFKASEYLSLKILNETNYKINDNLAKQFESYRAMKIGNTAPEIAFGNYTYLNGAKQNQIKSLLDLKSKYILVVFGARWCPKCNDEIPLIAKNYNKWRKKGVEVIYISLDTDAYEFNKSLVQYPFIVYCDFKTWESPIIKDYYVFGTPSMFLLNQNKEIILRPHSVKQMDAWVDWFLIQADNKK